MTIEETLKIRGVEDPVPPLDRHREAREQIAANAAFDAPYAIMNVLATVVACYGLLENSAAVVIGAMVIALLLGPIAGIALALVTGDSRLLVRSLAAEGGGVLLVLLVSFVVGRIHQDLPLGSQILSRTSPNILDLIIALAGGAAGAYATLSPKLRASLVGVAVATALVPPLSVCGLCLARGDLHLARGGFLLFFANFVAIQFAFSLVLGLFGLYRTLPDPKASRWRALGRHGLTVALLVGLTVFLEGNFARTVSRQAQEASIRKAMSRGLRAYPGAELVDLQFAPSSDVMTITAVVRASGAVSPSKVAALQAQLPHSRGQRIDLRVRSVITKTATATGYVDDSQEGLIGGVTGTDSAPTVPDTTSQ